jgi:putative phosphoesterase
MKIAIVSDIHDNLVNLKKCLNICHEKNIKTMICCGDVTNQETLKILSTKFKNDIFLVKGNAEIFYDEEVKQYKNIHYAGKIGLWKINNKKIGACHEPYLVEKVLEKGKSDIIFYGHTHKPWEYKKDGIKIINPGTLGGIFTMATFAIWDMNEDSLKLEILY